MTQPTDKLALVVGASRGLGLALARELLARGWSVVATVRGTKRTALHEVADGSGGRLTVEQLEVTDPAEAKALRDRIANRPLDLLFVNAGIANGSGDQVGQLTTEEFTRIMVTNALSPMRIVEEFGPSVRPDGQIAAMSSSLGSVSLNESGGWEVYRASKAALNTLMRSYAARTSGSRRSLALVDPGWVRTDMGGAGASLGVEDSIPGVIDALERHANTAGLRYFNCKGDTVPW